MLELLDDLDAFFQEHRRCGVLDGGVDEGRVRMACDCGALLARRIDGPRLADPWLRADT